MAILCRENPERITVYFAETKMIEPSYIQESGIELLDICRRAAQSRKKMRVDLKGVQFMSSAMLGVIVTLHQEARLHSVYLRFTNIHPHLFKILEITRLNRLFRLDDDEPDLLGTGVPNPKPPDTLNGGATPSDP